MGQSAVVRFPVTLGRNGGGADVVNSSDHHQRGRFKARADCAVELRLGVCPRPAAPAAAAGLTWHCSFANALRRIMLAEIPTIGASYRASAKKREVLQVIG